MKKLHLVNLVSIWILICENCFCLHVNSVSGYDRDNAASTLNLQPVNSQINTEIQKFKCPRCDLSEVYRSGKQKGIQRYRCKKCNTHIPLKRMAENSQMNVENTGVQDVKCPRCDGSNVIRNGKNRIQESVYKCKSCNRYFSLCADSVKQNYRLKEEDSRIYLNSIFSGEKNIFVNYLSSNKEDQIKLKKERQKRNKNIVAYYKHLGGICLHGSKKKYMRTIYEEVVRYFGCGVETGKLALQNLSAQFDEIEAKDIKAEAEEIIKNYKQYKTGNESNLYLADVIMRLGDIGFSCHKIVELLGLEEEMNMYFKKSFTCSKSYGNKKRDNKIIDTLMKEENARKRLNSILPKEKQILQRLSKSKKEKQERLNTIASYYKYLKITHNAGQGETYKKVGDCLGYTEGGIQNIILSFTKDQLDKIEAKDTKGKADEIIKDYEQHRYMGEEFRVYLTEAIIGLKDLGFTSWRIVELLGLEKGASNSFSTFSRRSTSTSNLQTENSQSNIENTEVQGVKCPRCGGSYLRYRGKTSNDRLKYTCKTCDKFFVLNANPIRQRLNSMEGDAVKYLNSRLPNGMYINKNLKNQEKRDKNIIAYYKQLGGIRMERRVMYIAEIYLKVANYFGYAKPTVTDIMKKFGSQFDKIKERDIKAEADEIIKNYRQHNTDNESNLYLADAIMSLRNMGFTCRRIVELLGLEKEKESFLDKFRTHSINSEDNNEAFDLDNLLDDEEITIESELPKKRRKISSQDNQISTNDNAKLIKEKDKSKRQSTLIRYLNKGKFPAISDDETTDQVEQDENQSVLEDQPLMPQVSMTEGQPSIDKEVENQQISEIRKETSNLEKQVTISGIVKQEIKKEPSNSDEQGTSSAIVKQEIKKEPANLVEQEFSSNIVKQEIKKEPSNSNEQGTSSAIVKQYPYDEQLYKVVKILKFYNKLKEEEFKAVIDEDSNLSEECGCSKVVCRNIHKQIIPFYRLSQRRRKVLEKAISKRRELDIKKIKVGALDQNIPENEDLRKIIREGDLSASKGNISVFTQNKQFRLIVRTIIGQNKSNIMKEEKVKTMKGIESSARIWAILTNIEQEDGRKVKLEGNDSSTNIIEILSDIESENEYLENKKKRRINQRAINQNEVIEILSDTESESESLRNEKRRRIKTQG